MKRTLITLLLLFIAVTASAQPRRPPQRGIPPEDIAELLDLTEAQQAQARELRAALQATVRPLLEQQRANREAVKAAVDAGNATAAGTALIAGDKIRDQIKAAHESFRTSFAAMLTPDQKAKYAVLEELRQIRQENRQENRRERPAR